MTTVLQRAANVAHKTVVVGLVGYAVYGTVSVGMQMRAGLKDKEQKEHPQAGYIQTLRDKVKEEYSKYYQVDHRDWYDKDDDSYLKNAPRPNQPVRNKSKDD